MVADRRGEVEKTMEMAMQSIDKCKEAVTPQRHPCTCGAQKIKDMPCAAWCDSRIEPGTEP